jgi:hypothetical protein
MATVNNTFPINILIIPATIPVRTKAPINISINPIETPEQTTKVTYKFNVNALPIRVNISDPLIETAYRFLDDAFSVYIDEDRKLKTLLNYGEDRQTVVLAHRYGNIDETGINKIQLKLLQPLPDGVGLDSRVFLSREVAKTLIDKVRIRFARPIDATPYLRPKNTKVDVGTTGKHVHNVTLQKLKLQSGSVGLVDSYQNTTFEDEIFRQWYSYDFRSSELNIDFSDYNNFVFYGSAAMRLAAFREKIARINRIETSRIQFLSSSTYTANTGSAGAVFVREKSAQYAKEKEDVIRGFDRYEQYLYFTPSGSDSPYSASFDYVDGGTEYNSIGYWPKDSSGNLYALTNPVTETWYTTQLEIAQRFDEFNENNLVNTIPTHVREHADDNAAYITFVAMVGHFFDTIKPYVDKFPDIYRRSLNPNEELSKDLINEVAESIGFRLPTLNSIYDLTDDILGTQSTPSRRELTAEIYKRLLHMIPFYAKSKGTRTALESFIRAFGFTPQLISIKETGTPVSGAYYTFEEYSTCLDFDETKTSYMRLPVSTSLRNPTTLQFNTAIGKTKTMTLLTGDDKWALNVAVHPSSSTLGRLEIVSGSSNTVILSSSYGDLYTNEFINVAIQVLSSGTSSLYTTATEGEDLLFRDIVSENSKFYGIWRSTDYVYVGGAGPRVKNRYEGTFDNLRLWNTSLSDEVLLNAAFDPRTNAGDTFDAPVEHLIVELNFNNFNSGSLLASASVPNVSPYKNKTASPSLENLFTFNISGSDFTRYSTTIRQDIAIAGSSAMLTNKVKVAEAPVFINPNDTRLYRTQSIVKPETKRLQRGRNKVIIAVSPTEIVNQNIIRNLGYENINAVLGSPTTLYTTFEKSLATLKKHYQQYHYVDVNTNRFVRIMGEISSVLNQVVDYFIPSKATVLKGILIEPNILEQVKIPPIKNIKVYGKNSRRTLSAAGSLTSSAAEYGATFNLSKIIDVRPEIPQGQYRTYKDQNKLIVSGTFEISTNKYVTTVEPTIFITGSTSNIRSTLNVQQIELNGQLDRYNTVDKYSGQVNTLITNVTASLHSRLTASVHTPTIITGSYTNLTSTIFVENIPSIRMFASSVTSSIYAHTVPMVTSSYATFNIKHVPYENVNYLTSNRPSSVDVGLSNMNKIPYDAANNGTPGSEPYYRLYPRKLFHSEIDSPRNGGATSIYTPALYDIPPSADFRDFGVYTFFSDDNGIYYFPDVVKKPAYTRQLNQAWNFSEQAFESVTTWSYGSSYNIYDVVYQQINTDDLVDLGNISKKTVNAGNGRYYVFKTRPAYTPVTDGSSFYLNSVPSYTPPSLDRDNWELLRFTPIQRRVAKRVVFDTFTVPNPELNNFKTTTVSIDRILDRPDRYSDSFTIPPISANSYITGELSLQNIAVLFAVQTNTANIRLRLYRTPETRDADIGRASETRPQNAHGVLLDMTLMSANALEITNPITTLLDGTTSPSGKIYYTIDNLNSSIKLGVNIQLFYFALQIEPRIPTGYLRKHYRFFRDNTTATKRRNYDGCKNTQDTTIDGLPAIQVFISEGTDLIVSPTQTNEEIITGGGGTLNVT